MKTQALFHPAEQKSRSLKRKLRICKSPYPAQESRQNKSSSIQPGGRTFRNRSTLASP
jgi:hypothetical protein